MRGAGLRRPALWAAASLKHPVTRVLVTGAVGFIGKHIDAREIVALADAVLGG